MQQETKTSLIALAAAFLALPAALAAQQPEPAQQQQQPACVASFMPTELAVGQEAAEVTITVSEAIGEVTELEAGESGIALAEADALPRTPLAAPDEPPAPIRMGDAENQWIVYLNTVNAQAGSHELTFRSEQGSCAGQVTVGEPAR
jgi:hypothetical protein